MQIIYKTKRNLKDASIFLFGLKGFSTYENELSLEELVDYKDKKIFLAIDKNIFNSDLKYLEKILGEIDNYNLEGILFYDLAVLSLAKRLLVKTPLIWSQDFMVTNYRTCNFYKKQGVNGVVLSSCITIDEILDICQNIKMDTFVYGFGYQTMAFSKRHLITNYFEFINDTNTEEINYMVERDVKYPVSERRNGTKFLSNEILNSIRYINKMKDAGIKYLILDDYMIDDDVFDRVVDIYEKCIMKEVSDEELVKMEDEIKKIVSNSSTLFLDKKTIYKVKRK